MRNLRRDESFAYFISDRQAPCGARISAHHASEVWADRACSQKARRWKARIVRPDYWPRPSHPGGEGR